MVLGQNTPFCLKWTNCAFFGVDIHLFHISNSPVITQQRGWVCVRANLTKCSHGRAGRYVIILIDASPPPPALIKIQKAAMLGILASPGNLWTLLRALCHPKAPVTDDIISIVRVTWELVVGTHTIQTRYVTWVGHSIPFISFRIFKCKKPKQISSSCNHLFDCHVGFLQLPILPAVKFHKIQ